MKKVLALLMAFTMALSFASCGGSSDTNKDTNTDSKAEATTVAAATDEKKPTYDSSKKLTEQRAEGGSLIAKIGMGAGRVVSTFNQAARDAVQTMINTVIPFMAFVSLLIGLIEASGVGSVIANFMAPLAGNVIGLVIIGFICSLPKSVLLLALTR